jgi:FkbM family methyltransferase
MIKINYFDLGLHKNAPEIDMFLDICHKNGFDYNIWGFEAHPEYCKKLQHKYSGNNKITIINKAISNNLNKIKLYISNENDGEGNSIFKTKNNVNENNYIEVDGIIFSEWLKENVPNLGSCNNILRFNIEGAEWFLMNDLISNNLNTKFKIFLGSTPDILKIGELKNKINDYNDLLIKNNINIHRYVGVNPQLNCDLLKIINDSFKTKK